MPTNRPLRVFLCHSSNDKPAVRELYQKLRAEPWIDPWLDEEKLLPGQKWKLEIPKAVRKADAVIICLSETSITKEGYVQREIKFALDFALEKPDGTIYLIPVKIKECEVPDSLSDWQWVDLFDPRGFNFILQSLKLRAKDLDLEVGIAVSQKEEMFTGKKKLFVEPPKPIIDTQKPSFLAHPTSEWIVANKIALSNGMEFMRVPAGKFLMGRKDGLNKSVPPHVVDIPYDYWMARFPITNEQYDVYVKIIGSKHPVRQWEEKRDHPVVRVFWNDLISYYKWLGNILKAEIPSGLILRLPTEAEWEKAAHGTDGRIYPWGDTSDENKANSRDFGKRDTTRVNFYSPQGDSPYGCADLVGNTHEWTNSLYKDYPYYFNDGREDVSKPGDRAIRSGFSKVLGGGFEPCYARLNSNLFSHFDSVGFRICLAPPLPK